jgi:hypothetical protein
MTRLRVFDGFGEQASSAVVATFIAAVLVVWPPGSKFWANPQPDG